MNGHCAPLPLSGLSHRREISGDSKPVVIIVDDDMDDWARLSDVLHSAGLELEMSNRIPDFLSSGRPETPVCLILDVRPGRDGLQFQQQLADANVVVPIIFVTECGDIAMSVKAMKNGAVDFLSKPFRDEELFDAIEVGLARDRAWRQEHQSLSALRSCFETLSQRERQVMSKVVKGKMNKQVAGDLGISEITVKAHRGRVMRKMKAKSLPDLARMADRIAPIHPWHDESFARPAEGRALLSATG